MGFLKFAQSKATSSGKEIRYNGWDKGLNKLVSPSKIKPNELSTAENIQYVEKGIIATRDGQQYFGNTTGLSSITGLFQFKKSDGTKQLLVAGGTALKKYNPTTGNFDDIAGSPTFTAGLDMAMVQCYDKVFGGNGTDAFWSYDGSTFTTYTSIPTPVISSVTKTGSHTGGTTTYSYRVSALNDAGQTLASTAVTVGSALNTLSTSDYITVTWGAVTGATSYNVYGRKAGIEGFMANVTATNFIDAGTVEPSVILLTPDVDTTAGVKGAIVKFIPFASRLVIISGSKVSYSGAGEANITAFGRGGYVYVSKSDGSDITGAEVFQNSIIVTKQSSKYQLTFTGDEVPSVTLLTRNVGCVAGKTLKQVENDVFDLSYKGLYVIGNEPNYAQSTLRTNELTARVRSIINGINKSRLSQCAAAYYANKYILAYSQGGSTYNNAALVYDRERLAFCTWTNQNIRVFAEYEDTDGTIYLLAGQDNGGRIVKLFSGSDDFGTPIPVHISLRQENLDLFDRNKTFKNFAWHFRDIVGTINLKLISDGGTSKYLASFTLNTGSRGANSGLTGYLLTGSAPDISTIAATTLNNDVTRRLKKSITAKALQLDITKNDAGAFTFLDYKCEAKVKGKNSYSSSELLKSTQTLIETYQAVDQLESVDYIDGGTY